MKLQIASDIHREFGHNPEIPDAGGDVLVLAGDIGHADDKTVEWIRKNLAGRFEEILYVPGNHEFYGQDVHEADLYMERMAQYGGYKWMNNRAVEIGGQRFVGSPLWANFCHEPWSMLKAGAKIADFRHIRHEGRKMTPGAMLDLHSQAVVFLSSEVLPGDIVITHWPPTMKARHMNHPNDDIAKYFCADIPKVVAATRASMWICGHTHYNVDFMLGDTRILSNQGGYPRESGSGLPGYDPWMIVEVEPEHGRPTRGYAQ